jgi:hypothetical protein
MATALETPATTARATRTQASKTPTMMGWEMPARPPAAVAPAQLALVVAVAVGRAPAVRATEGPARTEPAPVEPGAAATLQTGRLRTSQRRIRDHLQRQGRHRNGRRRIRGRLQHRSQARSRRVGRGRVAAAGYRARHAPGSQAADGAKELARGRPLLARATGASSAPCSQHPYLLTPACDVRLTRRPSTRAALTGGQATSPKRGVLALVDQEARYRTHRRASAGVTDPAFWRLSRSALRGHPTRHAGHRAEPPPVAGGPWLDDFVRRQLPACV